MNKNWIIAVLVVLGYLAISLSVSYYYTFPSEAEKQAQKIQPVLIDSSPVSDELVQKLSERQKYGDWPIVISEDRSGKFNPFRF